jgi:hypothetical protein
MAWPAQEELINAVDWSYYNQINQQTPPVIINVKEFCRVNPDIELFILRACWPTGAPDQLYPIYYDAVVAEGKKVAAYLWPNVTKTLDTTKSNWKVALGTRVPKLIALDFEDPSYGASNAALTYNARESLKMAATMFPNSHIIGYGRANWLETHFTSGFERDWKWWVAQYPLAIPKADGSGWRQYGTHRELANHLPIGNSFTPYLGGVGGFDITPEMCVGWQFSEYLYPSPSVWSRRMDGNSFKKSFIGPIYSGAAPLPPPPVPPTLEERVEALERLHIGPHGN